MGKKLMISSKLVVKDPLGAGGYHSANLTHRKYLNAGFFWADHISRCPHSMINIYVITCPKTRQNSQRDELLSKAIKFVKSLMYGVSILWDHFHLHMGINTSSLAVGLFSRGGRKRRLSQNDVGVVLRLSKYGVNHRLCATAYHLNRFSGSSGGVPIAVKRILERTVGEEILASCSVN
ncbi:hypothetical protein Tco_0078415 [Tanacetum coccineum]